ncbi:MAG TPA: ABC transporter substrate-binding protein [Stellaceae bacterium]|nr:ABC transporter substrate-binding protein [Stellaceae bacterium]
MRLLPVALAAAAALGVLVSGGVGAEPLRVGKGSPQSFSLVPVDVGVASGIFARNGLDIEIVNFQGGARLHQGVAAGAVDIAVGSGPELAFVAKGAPEIAVAEVAGPPLYLGIVVLKDGPAQTVEALRGQKIGVSSVGSISYWVAVELARAKGWGADGITPVSLGGNFAARIAALKIGAVAASVDATVEGFQLEEKHEGRLLIPVSDYIKDFVTGALFASNKLVHDDPGAVRRFIAAWFETIAYMRAHKDETTRIARGLSGVDESVESREYDLVMPMYTDDGRFDAKGLAVLQRSFVDMKLLESEPDMAPLYTEAFLPKR